MEKENKAKFWEQIKLMQDADNAVALSALRKAQKICLEEQINFFDYLFSNNDTMGSRYRALQREQNKLQMQCNRLWEENRALTLDQEYKGRGKRKPTLAATTAEKIKKITNQNNELKKELIWVRSDMYDHKHRCDELLMLLSPNKDKRDKEKLRTFEVFMKSILVIKSKKFWTSTDEIYKRYTRHWWDLPAMSKREFSILFSKEVKIKTVKGGDNKDRMGYNLKIDPYY